jgi:hypothetical protein
MTNHFFPQEDHDLDLPLPGVPYKVITHTLENSEMSHALYMEAIRLSAIFSCEAGSTGMRLFNVQLIDNVITGKFEIRLIYT